MACFLWLITGCLLNDARTMARPACRNFMSWPCSRRKRPSSRKCASDWRTSRGSQTIALDLHPPYRSAVSVDCAAWLSRLPDRPIGKTS